MFWYNDIAMNKTISPAPPKWYTAGGEPGKMEKLDDYTIRITFEAPFILFQRELAFRSNNAPSIAAPAHYMKQFHLDYTDKAKIDAMVKDAGLGAWNDLFNDRNNYWFNKERPGIGAWQGLNDPGDTLMVFERNPYYWKVDPAERQLPYIDKIEMELIENPELIIMKAANGELDAETSMPQLKDYTFLKENEEKGDYRVLNYEGDRAAHVAFWPNMSYEKDPRLGDLMRNTKFKQALSLGIDRDELNELFYYGLGVPRSITAIDSEPTYEEDVANLNIEFDPARANQILDELGFDKKNEKGIRLFPDGDPISFVMDWCTTWPVHGKVAEVVSDYWRDLGIDTVIKAHERSVYYELSYSNQFPMCVFQSPGTSLTNNWWIVPYWHNSNGYGQWYRSGGKEGVEPPEGSLVRKAFVLYDEARAAETFEEMVEKVKTVLRWGNENLWGIGTLGMQPDVNVFTNRLRNVPEKAPAGWHLKSPSHTRPEQWFIRQ
jgi:peptide/nickel transport system substrate-binding protein